MRKFITCDGIELLLIQVTKDSTDFSFGEYKEHKTVECKVPYKDDTFEEAYIVPKKAKKILGIADKLKYILTGWRCSLSETLIVEL